MRHQVTLTLQEGTSKVIYAYHPSDPRSPDYFPKHIKKGSRSLMLLNTGKSKPILPANLTFLDILNNQVRSVFKSGVFVRFYVCLIILSRFKCENGKPKDLVVLVVLARPLFCYVLKLAISQSEALSYVMFSCHTEVTVSIRDGKIWVR